ncbi:MAG: hypothetical protein EOP84_13600, partial [Verrucomicrobiaceae bacterium]
LGGSSNEAFAPAPGSLLLSGSSSDSIAGQASHPFTVLATDTGLLVTAEWQNSVPNVRMHLQMPDGTVLEEEQFAAYGIEIVNSTDKLKAITMTNPVAGQWQFVLPPESTLGTTTIRVFEPGQPPTLSITSPSVDVQGGGNVTIGYTANDADSSARITLFYSTQANGQGAVPIVADLVENNGAGTYTWNTANLAPGTYYIFGVIRDESNPSVTSPMAPGRVIINVPPPGSIAGRVFSDRNNNGANDSGETGVSGVTLFLDTNNNSVLDAGEVTTVTDGFGNYAFTVPSQQTYRVAVQVPTGYVRTSPGGSGAQSVVLYSGGTASGVDFGLYQTPSITGVTFDDVNNNGVRDGGEAAIAGRTVFLDANNDGFLSGGETSAVTDANGAFTFANLPAGTYRLAQVTPAGWLPVASIAVNVTSGPTTANLANFQLGTVSGRVYSDLDGDNVLDAGENGISGATVFIDANGDGLLTAGETSVTTDANGLYQFTGVRPGAHAVVTALPQGTAALASSGNDSRNVSISTSGQTSTADLGFRGAGLFGGDFTSGTSLPAGWSGTGDVTVQNGTVKLGELNGGAGLSYSFIVPAGAQYLSFIVPDLGFTQNGPNPPDAFEVALRDAQTGASLLGLPSGLNGTDAFLNLQNNGRIYLSSGVTVVGRDLSAGSVALNRALPVLVDISTLVPGTVATLSFDLLSFGPTTSSLSLDKVKLGVPEGIFGTLQFSAPTFTVNEAGGTVAVTVTRTNGDAGQITVAYATSNGAGEN